MLQILPSRPGSESSIPVVRAVALLAAVTLLAACGGGIPAADLDRSYERVMAETEGRAYAGFADSPERLEAAVARVQRYFADVTPESVRELTAETYAPDGYLNDTLAAIRGADRIEAYFLDTMERADVVRVEFLGAAVDGIDVYVRWRMHVEASALGGGDPVVTYGVSQFRFDDEQRLLLHKDFWDSGGGFFEHLPLIGRFVRSVRHAP